MQDGNGNPTDGRKLDLACEAILDKRMPNWRLMGSIHDFDDKIRLPRGPFQGKNSHCMTY